MLAAAMNVFCKIASGIFSPSQYYDINFSKKTQTKTRKKMTLFYEIFKIASFSSFLVVFISFLLILYKSFLSCIRYNLGF